MRRKTTSIMLIAPLVISLLGIYAPIQVARAVSTTVSVNPVDPQDPSSLFGVTLMLSNAVDVVAFDITLTYDETLLEYVSPGFGADWVPAPALPDGVFVSGSGSVRAIGTAAPVADPIPVDGSSILITHTFRMDLSGWTLLHLRNGCATCPMLGIAFVGGLNPETVDGEVRTSQTDRSDVKIQNAHASPPMVKLGQGETCVDLITTVKNDRVTAVTVMIVYIAVGPAAVQGFLSDSQVVAAKTTNSADPIVTAFCPPELNDGDTWLISAGLLADGVLVEVQHFNEPVLVSA